MTGEKKKKQTMMRNFKEFFFKHICHSWPRLRKPDETEDICQNKENLIFFFLHALTKEHKC